MPTAEVRGCSVSPLLCCLEGINKPLEHLYDYIYGLGNPLNGRSRPSHRKFPRGLYGSFMPTAIIPHPVTYWEGEKLFGQGFFFTIRTLWRFMAVSLMYTDRSNHNGSSNPLVCLLRILVDLHHEPPGCKFVSQDSLRWMLFRVTTSSWDSPVVFLVVLNF